MELYLRRTRKTETSTLGELLLDGKLFLYTLERPLGDDDNSKPPFCIPGGDYAFTIERMYKKKLDAPLLHEVPGRSGIFIHPGNFPKDTEGCILVGLDQSPDYVGRSRDAFARLMGKLEKGVTYQIRVR